MEQFILDQITSGLKYLPSNLFKSYFVSQENEETKAIRRRGFICGVCHPNENFEQIKRANIQWVRFDIPFPFGENGELSSSYIAFKKRAASYTKNGIKVMAVSPFPQHFSNHNIDINTKEGQDKIRETAVFLINDLRDVIGGIQVGNELGVPRFTLPYNMQQAIRFVGIQLEAMYPIRGDIIIGYNSAGPQADLHSGMRKYHKYCDYVGIDIYLGCFFNAPGFMWLFEAQLRYLWALTKKPILLQEFGYISGGNPKTKKEKLDILRSYAVNSEEEAKEHIEEFVERLPKTFANRIKYDTSNDMSRYFNYIFKTDMVNHLYKELPVLTKIPKCPHTPEGQANFYRILLPKLHKLPFVCGSIVYCYSDSKTCYVCGQSDCPTETRWGLISNDGKEKPSYYAIKEEFGKIQKK